MRYITEPAKQVPVVTEGDVIVCGGGPGGFPAAIAAARLGARTVLIERFGYMGGLATAGLVSPILGHTADSSDTAIVEGILREITERMHALGGALPWQETLPQSGVRFDAEALKIVLDEMVQEAGVELLLHCTIVDIVMSDDRINAVIVENKSGRQAVAGTLFIDATGDADIAFRGGAPTTHGRPFDGRSESMGSFIHLAGFDSVSDERRKKIYEQLTHEMIDGRFHFYNPGFLGRNTHHTGDHSAANMTRVAGDSSVGSDMTQAELSVRRDVWELVRYLRAHVPEFTDCYVQQTSAQVGPRESRQIVGPYALTGEDVHNGQKFEDGVARGSWWIDIHCPYGKTYPVHLCVIECPEGADCPYWAAEHERMWSRADLRPPKGDWYDIPYRSLLSLGIPNLLASGRCISATHEGIAGARVMGTCIAIGQAAGTAAALAVQQGVIPADLDVALLRRRLTEAGHLV